MIFIDCEQGTEEWHAARCGVITASKFKDAVDLGEEVTLKNGTVKPAKPSAKNRLYAAQVAIERISHAPCGEIFNSWQMKRGQEIEGAARIAYECATGNMATEAGIMLTEDRLFGYSTDGMVGDDGLIEIKSLVGAEIVIEMWSTGDTSEFDHQMQGGMWISGRHWCDFVMFCPQLESVGKALYIKRIQRDDVFIDAMVESLTVFERMASKNEAILRMPNAV
tara:strand:+ start:42 stop:707 length:666 start_codon:yes stop_codon:yes gene_type:complete